MAEDHHIIPVWFFVGVILFLYGLLILGSGIYQVSHPPGTVLAHLRPALWWGGLLAIIGVIYIYLFRPRKS
jgi:asparagine N-glycosylation enzyme membrane subunit Stt3